ncbi:MAG: DegV family protein [Clostridium sp.]
MKNYVIVTDSTADIPVELIEKLGVHVIPMSFEMEGRSYVHYPDEREMNLHEFYEKLRGGSNAVTTQINYVIYEEFFKDILRQGKDILYIAFSSGLSGTYNNSQIVIRDVLEEFPDRKIISIDSISASVGEGLLVCKAAEKKENGMDIEELGRWVEENKDKVCHWFTVEDLHHLRRGGRITTVEAIIGTTLGIKPLLSVDHEGQLTTVTKVRGKKKSLEILIERMVEDGVDIENQRVFIGHGDNLEEAEKLAQLMKERNLVKEIIISEIGPIIGTHTGSGIIGLAFIGNKNLDYKMKNNK